MRGLTMLWSHRARSLLITRLPALGLPSTGRYAHSSHQGLRSALCGQTPYPTRNPRDRAADEASEPDDWIKAVNRHGNVEEIK